MARASGVEIDPSGTLQEEVLVSVRATAENLNSMAMDVLHGRPTEIDWINGAVQREALKLGISAPENTKIIHEIRLLSS